ncbi:hypothetical protein M427DRAFT_132371 [Gonapodya prolifera JEL478]|uniref:Uncharacterized protein n=1 Tax=Gonapodya prolifera (strain JEL478) TaxID=1344416 RepID=A0A139AQ36_GONPJ|nr:hypothetical protein M427DRAFT_132371 [Gonapodya prolifera JEL478]|eukprot:KXS18838.1 hypothetical protein M427DRAFT_132371 [Gonapodya prolifera JEL478]
MASGDGKGAHIEFLSPSLPPPTVERLGFHASEGLYVSPRGTELEDEGTLHDTVVAFYARRRLPFGCAI